MSKIQQSTIRNRLLGAMTVDDFALLRPSLMRVPLNLREMLIAADERIRYVHFVERGIASVVADVAQDRIELGMVGPEGLTGVPVVLGVDASPHAYMVQAEGEALRIPAAALRAAMYRSPSLSTHLTRYAHCFTVMVAHTAYANASFVLEARLARWILMVEDRLQREYMPITHEFMAIMLGVRRPGVTVAMHALEGDGLIEAKRGRVTVLNRGRLKKLANTSYGVPEAEYARVMRQPLRSVVASGNINSH